MRLSPGFGGRLLHYSLSPATEFCPSAVERVHEHISETLDQHRVQQFFTEDEIRKQLDELHKKLGESYSVRNQPLLLITS